MEFTLAAITLGFLGSLHCVGMCGPISMALPVVKPGKWHRILAILVYNAGRISTYAFFGALFGMAGKLFVISGFQQALSITAGSLILLFLLFPKKITARIESSPTLFGWVSRVKDSLRQMFGTKSYYSLLSIGVLNGLLPCGLVYAAIAGAIATGSPQKGSLFMAAFGLGTLPAMLAAGSVIQAVSAGARAKIRQAVPVFVAIMACMLIVRGLNLGIPYLSPQFKHDENHIITPDCGHKN
jgi:sulfite exporter TauE/SafE